MQVVIVFLIQTAFPPKFQFGFLPAGLYQQIRACKSFHDNTILCWFFCIENLIVLKFRQVQSLKNINVLDIQTSIFKHIFVQNYRLSLSQQDLERNLPRCFLLFLLLNVFSMKNSCTLVDGRCRRLLHTCAFLLKNQI